MSNSDNLLTQVEILKHELQEKDKRNNRNLMVILGLSVVVICLGLGAVLLNNVVNRNANTISVLSISVDDLRAQVHDLGKAPVVPKSEDIAPPKDSKRVLTGPAGAIGPQGPEGIPGVNGRDGKPGVTGATGATGKQGKTGSVGAMGPMGPGGPEGPTGPVGVRGVSGRDGKDGDKGEPGEAGATGPPGEKGATGEKGDKGEPGKDGDSPKLPVFIVDVQQGGPCSVTFFYSDNTTKMVDICEGE